ncbi:MAG: alpha-amylase family protein [Armatimonadota bacterium]
MTSGDAYIRHDDTQWIIGTSAVEKVVTLDNGRFLLKSLKDKTTDQDMTPATASSEFSVSLEQMENRITGASGGWKLIISNEHKLKQGELQLDITLERDGLQVTKTYVAYPKTSIIREWVMFRNEGKSPIRIIEPGMLDLGVSVGDLQSSDFHWMTGGWSAPGSWDLKTESLSDGKTRRFDSYDPPPGPTPNITGDGVDARILLNGEPIWPGDGWAYSKDASDKKAFDVIADVKAGDKLAFQVNMHKHIDSDTTEFNPTIAYDDGETYTASKEFSGEQGKNGWRYQYVENGKYTDLTYNAGIQQWRKKDDTPTGTPFISKDRQHPHIDEDVVRTWTAPKDGKVRITGSLRNSGNGSVYAFMEGYGWMPGSSSYAPWYALYGRDTKQGLVIGWDYFGHWSASVESKDDSVSVSMRVAGHDQTLAPGESVTTPKVFTGLFRDDLDNAGNELLDWQYRYLWDYTREGWFPAIRMLGYWWNGTAWKLDLPSSGWAGGNGDADSAFRKVFRLADFMRYIGADVYHRDHGWWDKAGDWNGPDFRTMGSYLRKHDMGQLIYAFIYSVDPQWSMLKKHPEWAAGEFLGSPTLDMSRRDVVEFLKDQLDGFVEKWGPFEWRNDSFNTTPRDGDDTPMLGQDEGFREILQYWLDKHPDCAFQAVNGGGNYAGYDYIRYSSCIQFTDGGVGLLSNYYTSLLFPPDKVCHMPDLWNPDNYDKSTFRGLLSLCFDMTGETTDPAKLEMLREQIDIYHYLENHGVVGRWVKVYRPIIEGDDPTMYFQRMSGDMKKGIIITKHRVPGAVTIKPKGLLPGENYTISFQESGDTRRRTGSDLMEHGIYLDNVKPGELIYLNMPMHPGSKQDTVAPTAPSKVRKQSAENMGYPGVELSWNPGTDNNWVSYYEVLRSGKVIDKVAKGTYYFDHSVGADPGAVYAVRTVDGAGNISRETTADGPDAKPAVIFDDTQLSFTGDWQHKTGEHPAHEGTLSFADKKGASAELSFEGRKVTVFTKLGLDHGKAAISIDGGPAEIVDTYSADDIWGVGIYQKSLSPGKHTIRIQVTGEHGKYAKGTFVYLDGVRVDQ